MTEALKKLPQIDPQTLIAKAVESGANIEVLERLVSLSERVRDSSAREAFQTAFVNFQAECPSIKKNKVARIQGRSGGSYSYKYADLDEIVQTISPVMQKYGLSWSWSAPRTDTTHAYVACTIAHIYGHKESSGEVAMPIATGDTGANPAQRVGIALTYARRYSLTGILGIAPEDDTDAHGSNQTEKPVPPSEQKPDWVKEKQELPPVTYNKAELELATAALQTLLANPIFSDTDRIACSQWLKKKPSLQEIKAKLAEKKALVENPDAEPAVEQEAS